MNKRKLDKKNGKLIIGRCFVIWAVFAILIPTNFYMDPPIWTCLQFQFKKINHANHILSDEKKRGLYDKYGSFGLHIAEQFGDDVVETLMMFRSGWFQVRQIIFAIQLFIIRKCYNQNLIVFKITANYHMCNFHLLVRILDVLPFDWLLLLLLWMLLLLLLLWQM